MRSTASVELSGETLNERVSEINAEEHGEIFRRSYGARMGQLIEPMLRPLGFDWKIGVGIIGAFAAREVFISTMGVVYGVASDADEESVTLRERIRSERHSDGNSSLYATCRTLVDDLLRTGMSVHEHARGGIP